MGDNSVKRRSSKKYVEKSLEKPSEKPVKSSEKVGEAEDERENRREGKKKEQEKKTANTGKTTRSKRQSANRVETSINTLDGGTMVQMEEDIVKIMVVGVGGAGNNVVNRIVQDSAADKIHAYSSIKYVIVNTDKQALLHSTLENQVLIGKTTKGQGAGSDPAKGREAAEESKEILAEWVSERDLVFITAGMGGGTGTGASPVIARLAKEAGALVIAVVSTPFKHEGSLKLQKALEGIEKLKEYADALIIIDNNKLAALSTKKLSFAEVFALADEPLKDAILGIAGTVLEYGNQMNTDFSDIRAIMENKGLAHMAVGSSTAEEGAGIEATKQALESALTNTSIRGATGVVFKILSSDNLGFEEFNIMQEMVASQCHEDVLIKHGKHEDPALGNEVRVTIIATGIQQNNLKETPRDKVSAGNLSLGFGKKSAEYPAEETRQSGLSIPKGFL